MRPFRFKLQALLKVAEQQEQEVRHEMAKANAAVQRIRSQMDDISRTCAGWEERIRASQRRRLVAAELRHQAQALAALRDRLEHLRSALRSAEAAAEEVRHRLNQAACRRKSLERLRSRLQDAHEAEAEARENRTVDDMASTRAAERIQGGRDDSITGASR